MTDLFKLDGKTVIITGSGAGIGAECARLFARVGANVMVTDINLEAAEAVAKNCRDKGFSARAMQHDVTNEADWQNVCKATIEAFDAWDVLLNNAGIYIGGLIVNNKLEQVKRINETNIESVFLGMKYAAQYMQPDGKAGRGGSIINLSSVAGLIGVPGHAIYGATKGAVRSYSKHAAVEFGALGYGIRVNSLHPGLIDTAMGDKVFDDFVDIGLAETREAADAIIMAMTPSKRLGTTTDIANAALFLASDASSFMTGSELVVDGGMSAA